MDLVSDSLHPVFTQPSPFTCSIRPSAFSLWLSAFNFEQGQWYRNFAEIHPGVHISRDTVMVSSKTVFGEHTASEQFPHNGMQLHRHLTYQ